MSRRAFTLIELTVSIAIICALAGLVFAVLGPAREAARQRSCVSNLHQIGLAFAQYRADWDGRDPSRGERMYHEELGLPGGDSAHEALQPYTRSSAVLWCPSHHGLLGGWSSYEWPCMADEDDTPGMDLPGIVARRGMDYPLVACSQHNADLDFARQPHWMRRRLIVLRLSLQVQTLSKPVTDTETFNY
jgi:prepilin-type N-terminal cleavage/methylation domain-containing protein